MSYEADLKSHYADVSQRLGKYAPPRRSSFAKSIRESVNWKAK